MTGPFTIWIRPVSRTLRDMQDGRYVMFDRDWGVAAFASTWEDGGCMTVVGFERHPMAFIERGNS